MFYTYVLKSKNFDEMYIGQTSDLKRRLTEHNNGVTKSTKRYMPWELIYYEACINEIDSKRRENYFKSTSGRRALRLRLKEFFSGNA